MKKVKFNERKRTFFGSHWLFFKEMLSPYVVLSTWFGVGKLPLVPGTFGALAAYPVYYIVLRFFNSYEDVYIALLSVAGALTLLGIWSVSLYTKEMMEPDPSSVVIDEVVGQLLTVAISFHYAYSTLLLVDDIFDISDFLITDVIFFASFILFRIFDIWKPFGISLIDRKITSSIGVMLDDILAGVYAAVALLLLCKLYLVYHNFSM